jgi:glycosyltransferase involved in cell wall biosynthesis
MNILGLFLNKEIRTGGHRRYLSLLASLSVKKHRIDLLLNSKNEISLQNDMHLHRLKVKERPNRSVGFLFTLRKNKDTILRISKPTDWIIIFGETHLFAALYLKKILKSKLLFSFRSNAIRENLAYLKYEKGNVGNKIKYCLEIVKYWIYEHLVLKTSDAIVVQSKYDRNELQKRHKRITIPVHIIGSNYDPARFLSVYRNTNNSRSLRNLLFIGSINKRKGVFLLLEAFIRIAQKDSSGLNLTIAGFGPMEQELIDSISASPVRERVSFRGRIENPFEQIRQSDLVVVPSLFDSYPNVVLESIFTGTPVIASRVGGVPEMLEHEALLFEAGSVEAIEAKIEDLRNSASQFMAVKNKIQILQDKFDFDWPEKFEEILTKI